MAGPPYANEPKRIRTYNRYLGIQPSNVDDDDVEMEPGNEEVVSRDEGPPRKKRKDGGTADGKCAGGRADRASRARGGKTKNFNPGGERGKLHRELGIPESEKIGTARIAAATRSDNPEIRRDAIRARTMSKWNKG